MSTAEDRRWHPRVPEEDKVTVTILASPDSLDLEGRTFFCSTRDISAGGLRFCVHSDVPVDAKLELRVELASPVDVFTHVGRVVWEKELEEDGFFAHYIGVQFVETKENRQLAWRSMVSKKLSAHGTVADEAP
ncbi:MAG: PilZ domain-containing protein [Verrucomicrobia bacterium]|nr:PilZ domain-containing protein [Verrucomicrobiota bacterium]MDA1087562.1 PilZ domain-containing protein [Verrucomicrobiota bacterium]